MKNYISTGGAGFIGSHIAEFLSQEGHNVSVLDSLRTGFENNFDGFSVGFVKGDIRDEKLVEQLVGNADGVFHLATPVSVELGEKIIEITNSKSQIEFLADTQYSIGQALEETIEFYHNSLLIN